MAASDLIDLPGLIDNTKRFVSMRKHRWPVGVRCPLCGSGTVIWDQCNGTQPSAALLITSLPRSCFRPASQRAISRRRWTP